MKNCSSWSGITPTMFCTASYLNPKPTVQYNLRKRTRDLTLPTDVNAVIKQNFVYRMLFSVLHVRLSYVY